MKQKLHIFMTLLLLLVCGGASFGQTTETFKFSSFTASKETISFDGDNCTITLTKGTNAPFWSSSKKEARVYAKGSLVVTSDLKITKIVYTFVDNAGTFGSVTPSGYDESTKTWSSVTGSNEVTFNIGGTKGNYGFTQLEITYASSDKTSTTLSFGTDYDDKTITKNVGDYFEAPAILTPAVKGATIIYKSSDETVAEIADGLVEAKKEGTTTITASYAGDDTYAASSASYTLNVVDGRTATTLTFPNASYTFEKGEQNGSAVIEDNAAVLTPEDAGKVTYSITGTDGLADVMEDGSVLINTNLVGTATVTASFAGNDTYKASEATYAIEVKVVTGDEKFDFTKPELYGKGHSSSSDTSGDIAVGESISYGKIKLTVTKANNTNPTRFWTNDLRTYAGAQWTLTADNGYVISNVKITTVSGSKGNIKIGEFGGRNVIVDFSGTGAKTMSAMTVTYAKLPTESLTTAASGFATYAADYDVNYSDAGLTAYAITLDEAAKTVKYTEATGVVPAGKAVLVKGEAKTEYTLSPATEDAGDFTTDLQVSDGKVTSANGLYYVFATVNGKSGFKILADGMTIPAKKGYLKLSTASAKSFFELEGGEATGISEIEAEAANDNAAIYNLAGQRVSKGYKGIAIKNGKKFVK